MKNKADIGLIGLAVMGENLVLNMESKGFTVAVFNRTDGEGGRVHDRARQGQEHHRLPQHRGAGRQAREARARSCMLVKAGKAVDEFIDQLIPVCEQGDILIDGGNSHLPRHHPPHEVRREQGPALHRHRRLRRRRRRAQGPVHHARRQPRGVAARQADLPGHLRARRPTASRAATGSAKTAPATS